MINKIQNQPTEKNTFKNLTNAEAYKKGISNIILNQVNLKNYYSVSVAVLPITHKFNETNKPIFWIVLRCPYFEGYIFNTKKELYQFLKSAYVRELIK